MEKFKETVRKKLSEKDIKTRREAFIELLRNLDLDESVKVDLNDHFDYVYEAATDLYTWYFEDRV